jgi:AcrR family transcriptional regulator
MGRKGESNRQRIVEAADRLFYRRGYNQTSFQDISDETGIPRGNFYYYFKTKDDILDAVVDARIAELESWLKHCESETEDPRERVLLFISIIDQKQADTLQSGCPVGTLKSELAKDTPELQQKATRAFSLFRDWLKQQFAALGLSDVDNLSMDLLARMQGIALLACAFKDSDFIQRSHNELREWVMQRTSS